MAHHVFNRPDDGEMYYWMEECVAYCHSMLTETFGIEEQEITYVENPWCGGGMQACCRSDRWRSRTCNAGVHESRESDEVTSN